MFLCFPERLLMCWVCPETWPHFRGCPHQKEVFHLHGVKYKKSCSYSFAAAQYGCVCHTSKMWESNQDGALHAQTPTGFRHTGCFFLNKPKLVWKPSNGCRLLNSAGHLCATAQQHRRCRFCSLHWQNLYGNQLLRCKAWDNKDQFHMKLMKYAFNLIWLPLAGKTISPWLVFINNQWIVYKTL